LVLMDDVDVRRYRIASLRQQIAMVLQPPLVFPLSVRENIAFGRENATLEEITKAARLARIDRMIEMLPQGYDTVVDEEVSFSEENSVSRSHRPFCATRPFLRRADIGA
jgi:ATP-binding cassette, subfamily B, bacterial